MSPARQYRVEERLRSSDHSEPNPPESEISRLSNGNIQSYRGCYFGAGGPKAPGGAAAYQVPCWQRGKTALDNYQEQRFDIAELVEDFSRLCI